ncbi:integrin beta-1 [Patella vulgata]|uniref:integrin beta-1 n=1 Tax=Patella vulgata TaxID=6465 RepID=UPI00217F3C6A|nr:integrin beta-1 [Patella vulgata]XP_050418521.1 integrin beta-1 [Patella vulgata]
MRELVRLCLLLVLVHRSEEQIARLLSNPCANVKTCGECIQTASVCAWCPDENFPRHSSRCELFDHFEATGSCPTDKIVHPQYKLELVKNDGVVDGDKGKQPVQVQPQEINLKVRPNQPVDLKLVFKQAANYPVDIYFLLDMSYSMIRERDAQARLISLAEDMSASMSKITKNFRLGFGNFVDKAAMPFIPWTDEMLTNRCPLKQGCRYPFDFRNLQKLTENPETFKTNMRKALDVMSQSLDDPEGGMDGIMQVLSCEDDIGWSERSRRIVVYSSNSLFHLAGDGILGGAVVPNDGMCHLNGSGILVGYDLKMDYPSVSQIAAKVRETRTNVIFAVMENVYNLHEKLVKRLEGATIGKLVGGSANIIGLVQKNYDTLRSRIEFLPKNSENITIDFKSKCKGSALVVTNKCEGLEIGDEVEFEVTLNVNNCAGNRKRSVEISAVGLSEQLTVNLDVICDCECEKPGQEERNSPKCFNGNGTFECGQCTCNKGRYGRECECDETELSSTQSLINCKSNVNSSIVCSQHGDCVCGECQCYPIRANSARIYSGRYCECNDYNCYYSFGQICGGTTRGVCKCGQCQCLPGYTGEDCGCSTKNETCIALNGEICNGQGECECGRCQCSKEGDYRGPTCEDCPGCPTKCAIYKGCAMCKGFGDGGYNSSYCRDHCKFVTAVNSLPERGSDPDVTHCIHRSAVTDCIRKYTYQYNDIDPVIKVQRLEECPKEFPVLPVALGIVGAILLFGIIALIIFWCLKRRSEAKEFAQFKKDQERARWQSDENPIYKDPTTHIQNPTYSGGKKNE